MARGKATNSEGPNPPKRPMTAFFLYLAERSDSVKAANPSLKRGDVTKELSLKWGALTTEEKKPYQAKYQANKEAYEKELAEWKAVHGDVGSKPKKSAKGTKRKEDQSDLPPPPKRPKSAYLLFTAKHQKNVREENPTMKPAEVMKELGALWKAASEEEKKVFQEEFAENKKVYEHEKEEYEALYGKIPSGKKGEKKKEHPGKKEIPGKKKVHPDEAVGGNEVIPLSNVPTRKRVMLRNVSVAQKKQKIC